MRCNMSAAEAAPMFRLWFCIINISSNHRSHRHYSGEWNNRQPIDRWVVNCDRTVPHKTKTFCDCDGSQCRNPTHRWPASLLPVSMTFPDHSPLLFEISIPSASIHVNPHSLVLFPLRLPHASSWQQVSVFLASKEIFPVWNLYPQRLICLVTKILHSVTNASMVKLRAWIYRAYPVTLHFQN